MRWHSSSLWNHRIKKLTSHLAASTSSTNGNDETAVRARRERRCRKRLLPPSTRGYLTCRLYLENYGYQLQNQPSPATLVSVYLMVNPWVGRREGSGWVAPNSQFRCPAPGAPNPETPHQKIGIWCCCWLLFASRTMINPKRTLVLTSIILV